MIRACIVQVAAELGLLQLGASLAPLSEEASPLLFKVPAPGLVLLVAQQLCARLSRRSEARRGRSHKQKRDAEPDEALGADSLSVVCHRA